MKIELKLNLFYEKFCLVILERRSSYPPIDTSEILVLVGQI